MNSEHRSIVTFVRASESHSPNGKATVMSENESTYFTSNLLALGEHARQIKLEVSAAWKSGDKERVLRVQQKIQLLKKAAGEITSLFDGFVDNRDAGAFGAGYCTEVIRIRAKSDKVGRPKTVKVPTEDLL